MAKYIKLNVIPNKGMALFIILLIMLSIRSYILVLLLIFSLADTFLKTTEKSNYLSVYMHHNAFGSESNFQIKDFP